MKIFNKSEWKKVKLGDIFNLQMGKTPLRENKLYWNKGEYNWISISDMNFSEKYVSFTKEKITNLAVKESGIKIIPKNTVIMSFKLSIGKVKIVNDDIYSNEAIMAFIPKENILIDKNFLYYSLKSVKWNEGINKAVKGLTLNKSLISQKEILLPNLTIQKEIANNLDSIDNLLELRKKQLIYLKELSKSLFTRMFGNIKTNDKNWEIVKLEKYINIIGGYAFKNIDFKSSGIPLIRIGNINSGQFKSTNLVFIEENKKFEKFKVFPNDILISLTGTVGKDDYGNACILGDSYSEYYLNQRNAKIELTDKINKNFFLEIIKIKEVKKKLTGISRGIRQANISNKDIYNLSLPLPPIELQNKFSERIEKIEKLKFEIEKSIEMAQNLYNSLISKYFDS